MLTAGAVRDTEAAREFYAALFGWEVDPVPESGGRYWVIKGPDGSNGGMMPLPAQGIPPFWQPYFAVESLEGAQARMHELGGRVLTEPMKVPGGAFVAASTLRAPLSRCWRATSTPNRYRRSARESS